MTKIELLAADWQMAKRDEELAVNLRREIEDAICALLNVPADLDGTSSTAVGDMELKITGRITRSVNAELVQELAAEHGLTEHLSRLFRWKPELNFTAWKDADEKITKPLEYAITAKPGRPSFKVLTTNERK